MVVVVIESQLSWNLRIFWVLLNLYKIKLYILTSFWSLLPLRKSTLRWFIDRLFLFSLNLLLMLLLKFEQRLTKILVSHSLGSKQYSLKIHLDHPFLKLSHHLASYHRASIPISSVIVSFMNTDHSMLLFAQIHHRSALPTSCVDRIRSSGWFNMKCVGMGILTIILVISTNCNRLMWLLVLWR